MLGKQYLVLCAVFMEIKKESNVLVCVIDTNFVGFHFVGNRVVDGEIS